ncbi:MAG: ABC transporter ATP-binding protein [Deltaproteobacteria bacterium]|nr:ABC transporter ATP-binding protein [Deltaproteobacteria bacterium]MBW2385731.1 ABC transporter ATP-binding protein [Deltaproteobacteria bacterium]
MNAVLQVRDLVARRGSGSGRFELRVDALDVHAGEVLAVLGPNGAGKSTLLLTMAGLEAATRGSVERITDGAVTMVFQRPIAFAGTVQHNVRIALRSQGVATDEIDRRSADALAHFGIAGLSLRRASGLSGGELRRLALARAFALEPSVLLLDEPFDDLDSEAQESLSYDLRSALERTGVGVVVVTHDLRRAVMVSDRMAVLQKGRLEQVDARQTVLEHPVSPEIARVVGMTNLIPATMEAGGQAAADASHRLPSLDARPAGRHVWAGIRPEHLKVDIGRGEGESIGKAEVIRITTDGVLTTLDLRWGEHLLRTHLVAGRGLAREVRIADTVLLSVRPQDVHILDRPRAGIQPPR